MNLTNQQIVKEEISKYQEALLTNNGRLERIKQSDQVLKALESHFIKQQGPINIIETGASHSWDDGIMGLMFANISQRTGGKIWIVDIDTIILKKSMDVFTTHDINCAEFITSDSVSFLNEFDQDVDLIYLDSWDLNLLDPYPAALHGWREFNAIKDKVKKDTIIIVDDNYFQDSWVEWVTVGHASKIITITDPIVGKGAHIWAFAKSSNEWDLISEDVVGNNCKVIIKKN